MKSNKKFLKKIWILPCLLFLTIIVFFSLQKMQVFIGKALYENQSSTQSLTDATQEKINKQILADWGTPVAEKTYPLSGVYNDDNNPFSYLTGEYWYYLTGDVYFDFKKTPQTFNNQTKIHILLNGYAMDGNVYFVLQAAQSALHIYDKLPNQTLAYGNSNTVQTHYYSYNTETENYDIYSDKLLAGMKDETNLPTFTKGSYIVIEGSRIGANSLSSTYVSVLRNNNNCYLKVNGNLHLYSTTIIGKQNAFTGSAKNGLIYTYANATTDSLQIIQCNIIGNNLKRSGHFGAVNIMSQGNNQIAYSNIYGNKVNSNSVGVQIADCKYNDLVLSYSGAGGSLNTLYASNIGAFSGGHINSAVYYIYGVDFGNQFIDTKITNKNFKDILQNLSNLSGKIELVANIILNYNGNSPNLTFAVRKTEVYTDILDAKHLQRNENTMPIIENQLTLHTNAEIQALNISGGKCLQNGKILSNITMQSGQLEVLGDGQIVGALTITGGDAIVHKNATVEEINCKNGNLTIQEGANVNWNKVNIQNGLPSSTTKMPIYLIVVIVLSILLVVIAAVLFLVIAIKKKNARKLYNHYNASTSNIGLMQKYIYFKH